MWPLISARLRRRAEITWLLVIPRIYGRTRFTSCGSCAIIPVSCLNHNKFSRFNFFPDRWGDLGLGRGMMKAAGPFDM